MFEQNLQITLDFGTNENNQQTRWFLCSKMGGEMGSTCSSNVSGLHRGNSTTGVVNKSISNSDVDNPTSSSMSLLGSVDSRGISWDNSTVKVGDHASWQGQEAEVSSSGSSNFGSVGGDHGSVGES